MKRPKELVIATKNRGKVMEIKHLLKPLKLKVLSLPDLKGIGDIKENGKTFKANAVKKASAVARKLKTLVMADDSGLQVEALNGKPGIKSARFAGPNPTTKKLCVKLLRLMRGKKNRKARFVCDIAMAMPGGKIKVVEGTCRGRIIDRMLGTNGFGYDPVFVPQGHSKTFAQMNLKYKNQISHRGKALKKAKAYIATIYTS
jgi:XTP/dITP diphosphohydrolase